MKPSRVVSLIIGSGLVDTAREGDAFVGIGAEADATAVQLAGAVANTVLGRRDA